MRNCAISARCAGKKKVYVPALNGAFRKSARAPSSEKRAAARAALIFSAHACKSCKYACMCSCMYKSKRWRFGNERARTLSLEEIRVGDKDVGGADGFAPASVWLQSVLTEWIRNYICWNDSVDHCELVFISIED